MPMCIVYTIQSLEKASITYAAIFNLQADTHLHGSEYSWLSRWVTLANQPDRAQLRPYRTACLPVHLRVCAHCLPR
jgi:hypothetical protein